MSDALKKRAEEQAKAREARQKKAEERYAKTQETLGASTAGEMEGERTRLAAESAAVNQAIWPLTGIYPEPAFPRLHVIPAGMWRYELPQTSALDSMQPPSEEADPNAAILDLIAKGGHMVDTQADETPEKAEMPNAQQRAEARQQPHRGEHRPQA